MRTGSRPLSRAPRRARLLAAALVGGVLLLPARAVLAADGFERDQTPLPPAVTSGAGDAGEEAATGASGGIVRMIVGLAIVLAVIYGVYWLLKAYRKSKLASSDGRIEIVATTALAPNRAVHLIRVGNELVLVGSAEQGVTRLRVYGAGEAAELEPFLEAGPSGRGAPARGGLAPSRSGVASRGGGQMTRAATSANPLARAVDSVRWRTVRR